MPREFTYDPECKKLADHFIAASDLNSSVFVEKLAQAIQDTVDDFFAGENRRDVEEKRIALVSQCMEVARMALHLASVNYELAVIHRAPRDEAESFLDMVGKFSHERMETLANILNGMDAVQHEDAERSAPIFERARRLFPINPEQ